MANGLIFNNKAPSDIVDARLSLLQPRRDRDKKMTEREEFGRFMDPCANCRRYSRVAEARVRLCRATIDDSLAVITNVILILVLVILILSVFKRIFSVSRTLGINSGDRTPFDLVAIPLYYPRWRLRYKQRNEEIINKEYTCI